MGFKGFRAVKVLGFRVEAATVFYLIDEKAPMHLGTRIKVYSYGWLSILGSLLGYPK